jgi:hypothetical protein
MAQGNHGLPASKEHRSSAVRNAETIGDTLDLDWVVINQKDDSEEDFDEFDEEDFDDDFDDDFEEEVEDEYEAENEEYPDDNFGEGSEEDLDGVELDEEIDGEAEVDSDSGVFVEGEESDKEEEEEEEEEPFEE